MKMLAVLVERVLSDLELNINDIDSLAVILPVPGLLPVYALELHLLNVFCFGK
jgi:hypothetical protein